MEEPVGQAEGQGPGQRTGLSSHPGRAVSVLQGTRRHRGARLPSDKGEAGPEVGKGRAQVPRHCSRERAARAPGPDAAGRSGPCRARCAGLGTLGPGGESGRPGASGLLGGRGWPSPARELEARRVRAGRERGDLPQAGSPHSPRPPSAPSPPGGSPEACAPLRAPSRQTTVRAFAEPQRPRAARGRHRRNGRGAWD